MCPLSYFESPWRKMREKESGGPLGGSLDAYTDHLLETDPAEGPLDRLCRETETNTRQSRRGRPREEVEAAIRAALEETVFRFQLVMRINVDLSGTGNDNKTFRMKLTLDVTEINNAAIRVNAPQ